MAGTPSPACRTAHGIRPRMALRDAEKMLGKVRDIELSEVEMRSVARFTQQPKWLNIRVRGDDFGNMPSARFRLPLHSKKVSPQCPHRKFVYHPIGSLKQRLAKLQQTKPKQP